ncbi:MAG: HutD/Ves family protein [Solimonas sp.]
MRARARPRPAQRRLIGGGGGVNVLRSSAHQRMPWKNGGGETFEIAVSPPAATLESLDWRISMAVVAQDGPFSVFPDIDRTLCVIDGAGLQLDFGVAQGTHAVTRDSPPFAFAADAPMHARLIDGPIMDLNVMTRRGRYRHAVRRIAIDAVQEHMSAAGSLLLFCEQGQVLLHIDGQATVRLDIRDCAIHETAGPRQFTLAPAGIGAASVCLIELDAISG